MSLAKELSSWCVLVVWNCGKPWDHLGIFHLRSSTLFFQLPVHCRTFELCNGCTGADVTVAMGWYYYY